MTLSTQRVFHYDGSLNDISKSMNDINSNSEALTIAATDYIYIGSDLPFNHRWFQVASANAATATWTVEVWDGSAWVAAVDIVDYSEAAGVPLAADGIIKFTPDRNKSWARESTTEDIPSLSTLKVYELFWIRLQPSAELSVTLNYIGFKFAQDDDLYGLYPELERTEIKTAFQTGKTDWDEQQVGASEEIVRYLKKKGIVWNGNQILDWEQFSVPNCHKVAEMVYFTFSGEDMEIKRKAAKNYYFTTVDVGIPRTDKDQDARLDPQESKPYQTTLVRR